MATSLNRSDTNHREKVQKVFIQRDYSEGTNVKFQTKFPPELEGLIDRHSFEQTINTLNRIYSEAEKTSPTTFCEGCLACLTSYVIYLCIETHYQKCLKRIAAYLDDQNETVYLPRGLLITDPIERGLRIFKNWFSKMTLLVENLCPQLTADIINQLKKVRIHTVSELVSTNIEELSKTSKIPYKELVYIRHNLLSKYGCFPQRADSLYAMLLETMHVINTGCKKINNFLKGGIYTGEVTELYGPPGSGKTQFCLSIAASLVSESHSTMLYLDSNGNFSAGRIREILANKYAGQITLEEMHRIRVANIQDIYSFLDILERVKSELNNQTNTFFRHLKVIVIDSITHLLSPCFGGKYLDGHGFMSTISHLFKVLCSEHMIAVLVTNNTVQSESQDIKAGLGPNWKYVPSVSLCLNKVNNNKNRKLSISKSCRSGLYNEATFCISESGIDD